MLLTVSTRGRCLWVSRDHLRWEISQVPLIRGHLLHRTFLSMPWIVRWMMGRATRKVCIDNLIYYAVIYVSCFSFFVSFQNRMHGIPVFLVMVCSLFEMDLGKLVLKYLFFVWCDICRIIDEAEREVLYEHCSRMRESFCRWMECDVLLNTPGALLRHLGAEHGPKRINAEVSFFSTLVCLRMMIDDDDACQSPWTCQWTGCGYTVISRDDYRQHIEKHAVFPLWCPYRGARHCV